MSRELKLGPPVMVAARGPRKRRRALRSLLGGVAIAGLLGFSGTASATKVKGLLQNFRLLENPVWKEAQQPKKRGYSFREPSPTVRAEYRKLYPHIPKELCVAALATEPQKPQKPILIRVGGGRTTPVTLVVTPGTQLQFLNTDPFKHRLYGVGIGTFNAADTIRGATRDWTVPQAGTFEVRDELAPSLRFWVIAEPNLVQAVYPNMKGEFQLNLPDQGEYTLQAFFAGQKVGAARQITAEGRDLDLLKEPFKVAPDEKKEGSASSEKKAN